MNLRHVILVVPFVLSTTIEHARAYENSTTVSSTSSSETSAGGVTGASGSTSTSLALLPIVGSGLGADELARIQKVVQAAVDERYTTRAIPGDAVRSRLDAGSTKGLHCDRGEIDCIVQLGIVARADQVILATLGPKGAAVELAVRLVDVGNGEQLAYAAGPVGGEPTIAEVSALLAALDDLPARTTRVELTGPEGALVVVDGNNLGALPYPALTDLAPGKHTVSIIGTLRHDATIDVRRGETLIVDAPAAEPLVQIPQGPNGGLARGGSGAKNTGTGTSSSTLPWIGVASGGAAVIVGGAGVVVGVTPRLAYQSAATRLSQIENDVGNNHDALVHRKSDIDDARTDLNNAEHDWQLWGAPLLVAGAVVLGVGAVVAGAGAFGLVE